MEKQDKLKVHIKKITDPIFEGVLKETNSNSMTTIPPPKEKLWRPNNYRRQIEVRKKDNSIIKKILTTIGPTKKRRINFNEHTKLISIKNYVPNITLQYGKNKLTGIYSQNIIYGHKETFLIERRTWDEINKRIDEKSNKIRDTIDSALNSFIDRFKLRLEQQRTPEWSRYEDWLKGIDFIDNIPRETIIHDTYFKKVYPEGIELIQTKKKEKPTVHLKNIVRNQLIRDISPEIEAELNKIGIGISQLGNTIKNDLNPILIDLKDAAILEIKNKKLHQGVLRSMDKTMKQIRDDMRQRRLKEYM